MAQQARAYACCTVMFASRITRDHFAKSARSKALNPVGVLLTGSQYRAQDIEPELLQAADIVIDYGVSKYHNPECRSGTMINFRDLRIVRRGVCCDAIE